MPHTKVCRLCGEEKSKADFYPYASGKDGLNARCKTCYNAAQRRRHHGNRVARLEKKRQYRIANRDKVRESQRRYHHKKMPVRVRQMLAEQNGRCAICRLEFDQSSVMRRPNLDHDHLTADIRGLLCQACNVGLGFFSDSIARLEAAAQYLARPKLALQKNTA